MNKSIPSVALTRSNNIPLILIITMSILFITISIICMINGYFIIFQNLFYIPIIISCMYYFKKGLLYSIIIAITYFILINIFTNSIVIIIEALVRVFIFILVAGVITYISYQRKKVENSLHYQQEHLEELVNERTKQTEKDYTELKRAEEAIRESEIRFKRLFDNINVALALHEIIIDENNNPIDFIYLSVNPMFEKITNLKSDDVIGKRGKEIIPNLEKRWIDVYAKVALTGESVSFIDHSEYLNKFWDVKAYSPKPYQFAVAFSDVTERIHSDDILKKTLMRQEALLAAVPDIIMEVDNNKIYTWTNKAGMNFFGNDVIGRSADYYFVGEQVVFDVVQPLFQGDDNIIYIESWQRRIDGEVRLLAWWCRSLKDNEGNVIGALSTARDITESKKAEESLRKSELLLSNAMEMALLGPWEYDVLEDVFIFNDTFYKVYHTSVEEIGGYIVSSQEYAQRFVHPDDIYQVSKEIQGVINSDDPRFNRFIEHRIIYGDGGIGYISVMFSTIRDSSGKAIKTYGVNQDITERKRSEEALIESEANLKTLLNIIPDLVWFKDLDGKFLKCNFRFESLFNEKECNIIGKTDYDFVDKELADFFRKNDKAAIEAGKPMINEELVTFANDGHQEILETIKTPVFDVMGNLMGVLGIGRDITTRKISEQALRENEQKLREVQEMAHLGFWYWDIKTGAVEWSDEVYKIFGLNPQEFIPNIKSILELSPWPEENQRDQELIQKAIESHEPGSYEQKFLRPDKSTGYYYSTFQGNYNENGELISIVGTVLDITNRKTDEIAIREKEVQYRNLANSGLALIWTSGADKLCNYFNDTWLEFTGRTLEQELGNGWADGVHPDDFDFCLNTYLTAFDKREKFDMEYRLKHNCGDYRWIRDLGTPNYDSNGDFIGYIGYCFDVTEFKTLERELISAKEKAEESDRLKTAFLENISHEIRTPLNGIIGFANILTEENLSNEEVNEFSNIIQQSGNRLLEIVNNVLDISKIETNQFELQFKNFSLNNLLNDLFSFFYPLATSKNLKFNCYKQLDDKNSMIYSDDTKLSQVLTNLINNAIKYALSGSVSFGYNLRENFIEFFVKDTGIGIDKIHFDRIFERFAQINLTRSKPFEGAGLGLAISKGLVELLGGKIWLESELDKGTTFFFTIPFSPLKIESTENSEDVKFSKTKNFKVLIVEDDNTSYMYLSSILKSDDFVVLMAENGVQALELVQKIPDIDIILMDIKMPEMDGYEATKQIKSIRPNLPIIAQTAYAFADDREKILSIGCDEYILKPIDKYRLLSLINQFVK